MNRCRCGAPIINGHHCENGHMQNRVALAVVLAALLSGCAAVPDSIYTEIEHTSHPLAGWPTGPANEEDGLTVFNAGGEWKRDNAYLQMGFGYKLVNEGFRGPPLTFNLRYGYRFDLRGRP